MVIRFKVQSRIRNDMKKMIHASLLNSIRSLPFGINSPAVLCASALGAMCLGSSALAGPDPGVTNGSAVFYTGNQSQGVSLQVSTTGPGTLVVSNLTSAITPPGGVNGVQIGGSDTSRNLTAILDQTVNITNIGDNASGILAENAGGDAAALSRHPRPISPSRTRSSTAPPSSSSAPMT